jgi:hypothetical protein
VRRAVRYSMVKDRSVAAETTALPLSGYDDSDANDGDVSHSIYTMNMARTIV